VGPRVKLLVVEDEPKMARLLQRGLREEGHQVDHCARGMDALAQSRDIDYDVILLDWGLPDLDGVALLRRLRDAGLRTPVLMLTARGSVGERVTGLRAGADDFLVKPFDWEELLARIEALHRRGAGHEQRRRLGSVELDPNRRALARGNAEESLTAREYELASELFGHAGETLTRTELLSRVWGSAFDGGPNIVDVYVGYLRAKLKRLAGDDVQDVQIVAARGVGFRVVVQASGAPGTTAPGGSTGAGGGSGER
jgi:DNA-binding response OmpR family regulator